MASVTFAQIGADIDGVNAGDKSGTSTSINEAGTLVAVGEPELSYDFDEPPGAEVWKDGTASFTSTPATDDWDSKIEGVLQNTVTVVNEGTGIIRHQTTTTYNGYTGITANASPFTYPYSVKALSSNVDNSRVELPVQSGNELINTGSAHTFSFWLVCGFVNLKTDSPGNRPVAFIRPTNASGSTSTIGFSFHAFTAHSTIALTLVWTNSDASVNVIGGLNGKLAFDSTDFDVLNMQNNFCVLFFTYRNPAAAGNTYGSLSCYGNDAVNQTSKMLNPQNGAIQNNAGDAYDGFIADVFGTTNTADYNTWLLFNNYTTVTNAGSSIPEFGVKVGLMPDVERANIMNALNLKYRGVAKPVNPDGRIRVINYSASAWQTGTPDFISYAKYTSERFGYAVAMSDDGTVMVVGAPGYDSDTGLARKFVLSGTWGQVGPDLVGTAPGDRFGAAVAISGDGTRIVIGAPGFVVGPSVGKVYTFSGTAGGIVTTSGDITEGSGLAFGSSVSTNLSGSLVAVGDSGTNKFALYDTPGAWAFTTGTTFFTAIDPDASSVSISNDGTALAVASGVYHRLAAADWVQNLAFTSQSVRVSRNGLDVVALNGTTLTTYSRASAGATTFVVNGGTQAISGGINLALGEERPLAIAGDLAGSDMFVAAGSGLFTDAFTEQGRTQVYSVLPAGSLPVPTAGTVTAAAPSPTTVDLTWSDAGVGYSYIVRYSTVAGNVANGYSSTTAPSGGTQFGGPITAELVTVTGLTQGTTYYFNVYAYDPLGAPITYVGYNQDFKLTTIPIPDVVAPTSLAGFAFSTSSVSLSWTAPTNAVGYRFAAVYIINGAGTLTTNPATLTAAPTIGTIFQSGISASSVIVTGLTPGTLYDFNVYAYDPNATGSTNPVLTYVAYTTISVSLTAPVVATPGSLVASNATSSSVDLNWDAATGALTSYDVYYHTLDFYVKAANIPNGFVTPINVLTNSATVPGLNPSTTYFFNILAKNGNLVTPYTHTFLATLAAQNVYDPLPGGNAYYPFTANDKINVTIQPSNYIDTGPVTSDFSLYLVFGFIDQSIFTSLGNKWMLHLRPSETDVVTNGYGNSISIGFNFSSKPTTFGLANLSIGVSNETQDIINAVPGNPGTYICDGIHIGETFDKYTVVMISYDSAASTYGSISVYVNNPNITVGGHVNDYATNPLIPAGTSHPLSNFLSNVGNTGTTQLTRILLNNDDQDTYDNLRCCIPEFGVYNGTITNTERIALMNELVDKFIV